jgi:hypothetical protein
MLMSPCEKYCSKRKNCSHSVIHEKDVSCEIGTIEWEADRCLKCKELKFENFLDKRDMEIE